MPSEHVPNINPNPKLDTDNEQTEDAPVADRPSRVYSLLGLPAPIYPPPRLPMSLPQMRPTADRVSNTLPAQEPVTHPSRQETTLLDAPALSAPPEDLAVKAAGNVGLPQGAPPAAQPSLPPILTQSRLDASVATTGPTADPLATQPTRRAAERLPAMTDAVPPIMTDAQRQVTQQSALSVPSAAINPAAAQKAVEIAIPGRSRETASQSLSAQTAMPSLSQPASSTVEPTADGRVEQAHSGTAPDLSSRLRLAGPASLPETELPPQLAREPMQAGKAIKRPTQAHPVPPALPEPVTQSHALPSMQPAILPATLPTVLPQVAGAERPVAPAITLPTPSRLAHTEQTAWGQIEQLRRTVQGLQAKLADQPVVEQPVPPAPIQPPPRPVIIKRSAPAAPTLVAFWARRHLGRSHLRLLR